MHTISRLGTTFLLNAAWQGVAVVVVAVFCAWLMRRSRARHQHVIWVAALAASVLLPVWSLIPRHPAASERVEPLVLEEPERSGGPGPAGESSGTNVAFPILVVYAGFVLYRLARFGSALRHTRRILASATPVQVTEPIRRAMLDCTAALGMEPVEILRSASIPGPITIGSRRPIIMLPDSLLAETSPDILRSVLGHELAHVRRRDFALNILYELLYTPVWMHPAAALVRRRVEASRELACDEVVAEWVLDARTYARSLVDVAGALSGVRQPACAMGIADSDILEQRVERLVGRSFAARANKAAFVAAAVGLAVTAWAAANFATAPEAPGLAGTVFDASGAVVPGAQVLLRRSAASPHQVTVTDGPGGFRFDNLPAGPYHLEVRKPGFRLYRSKAFRLDGGGLRRATVSLSLGMVHETLTVHGD